jgi:hypothetical protein
MDEYGCHVRQPLRTMESAQRKADGAQSILPFSFDPASDAVAEFRAAPTGRSSADASAAGEDPSKPSSLSRESMSGAWARYFKALCTI